MTADEQKRLVASLLPEKITTYFVAPCDLITGAVVVSPYRFIWQHDSREVRSTEWLAICAMAEQTLTTYSERAEYARELHDAVPNSFIVGGYEGEVEWDELFPLVTASAEVRILALCRTKFPERFKQPAEQ